MPPAEPEASAPGGSPAERTTLLKSSGTRRFDPLADPGHAGGVTVERCFPGQPNVVIVRVVPAEAGP